MNCEILRRNAAWARANLQMQASEFYALTPIEFHRIFEEFKLRQKRDDWTYAKLCHVVATSAGAKLADPDSTREPDPLAIPYDYFAPWYVHKKRKPRGQSTKSIIGTILNVFESNQARKQQNGQ